MNGTKALGKFLIFLGILGFIAGFVFLIIATMDSGYYSYTRSSNPWTYFSISSFGSGLMCLIFGLLLRNSAFQLEGNDKIIEVLSKIQAQLTTQNQKLGKITSVSSNETLKTDAKTEKTNKVEKKVETKQEAPTKKMVKSRLEEIFDSISSSLLSQEKERIVKEVMDLESEALTFSLSLEEQENITDKDLLSNLTASNIEDSPVGNMLSWVKRLAFEYDLPKKALDLAKIAIYYNSSSGFISSAIQLLLAVEKLQEE